VSRRHLIIGSIALVLGAVAWLIFSFDEPPRSAHAGASGAAAAPDVTGERSSAPTVAATPVPMMAAQRSYAADFRTTENLLEFAREMHALAGAGDTVAMLPVCRARTLRNLVFDLFHGPRQSRAHARRGTRTRSLRHARRSRRSSQPAPAVSALEGIATRGFQRRRYLAGEVRERRLPAGTGLLGEPPADPSRKPRESERARARPGARAHAGRAAIA
jgi:hypothetical protein